MTTAMVRDSAGLGVITQMVEVTAIPIAIILRFMFVSRLPAHRLSRPDFANGIGSEAHPLTPPEAGQDELAADRNRPTPPMSDSRVGAQTLNDREQVESARYR